MFRFIFFVGSFGSCCTDWSRAAGLDRSWGLATVKCGWDFIFGNSFHFEPLRNSVLVGKILRILSPLN
jgi:hypothetical protein